MFIENTGEEWECDVCVYQDQAMKLMLGKGIFSVIEFSRLVDKKIKGAYDIERSFSCNVDLKIKGKDLKEFIAKEYSRLSREANQIFDDNEIYWICCYDMS